MEERKGELIGFCSTQVKCSDEDGGRKYSTRRTAAVFISHSDTKTHAYIHVPTITSEIKPPANSQLNSSSLVRILHTMVFMQACGTYPFISTHNP